MEAYSNSKDNITLSLICFVNFSLVILLNTINAHKKHQISSCQNDIKELKEDLKKEICNRNSERLGRINLQKSIRKEIVYSSLSQNHGFIYHAIGIIESPFPDRRGTPRQPLLVPAARGIIRFDRKLGIQYEHFAELKEFSHIWVIFAFHENTNIDKQLKNPLEDTQLHRSNSHHVSNRNQLYRDKNIDQIIVEKSENHVTSVAENIEFDKDQKRQRPFDRISSKVKPPRCPTSVGCLSTRSPHRPNNIGLSVCQILEVGKDFIVISGIDMVHGTPVLDVKPYIPYDIVPDKRSYAMSSINLKVPEWIYESPVEKSYVIFSAVVEDELACMEKYHEYNLLDNKQHAMELITQVLKQDIRGNHQGRGSQLNNQKSVPSNVSNIYTCILDNIFITFTTYVDKNTSKYVDQSNEIDIHSKENDNSHVSKNSSENEELLSSYIEVLSVVPVIPKR